MTSVVVYYAKALDAKRVTDICALIQGYFKQVSVPLNFVTISPTRLPRMKPADNPVYQYQANYENIITLANQRVFFFVQPYHQPPNIPVHRGGSYIGEKYGVHSFAPNRKSTPNSYEMTLFGALHEFGHLLGAKHTTGDSIMNRDPIGTAVKNNWTLSFSEKSAQEMRVNQEKE